MLEANIYRIINLFLYIFSLNGFYSNSILTFFRIELYIREEHFLVSLFNKRKNLKIKYFYIKNDFYFFISILGKKEKYKVHYLKSGSLIEL